MSVSKKLVPSSSASSSDLDPLLKDLTEKKLSFRKNVVSLAAELKDVRNKLSSQEQLFARESQTRKVAETKARSMEEEVSKLQKCLLDKDEQLRSSTHSTEQYLSELDDLRTQLSSTQVTAEASAASAKSAQQQCLSLLKELNEKDSSLKEHELRVNKLGEQLDLLQKDLQARELSQRQLKDEVVRIETDIMDAVAKAGLREEIRILSVHWTNKTKELESQLEKHRRTDQELKKRVLKLEFCLQESQSQMRKLKRMGEKRDKALKELMDQVAMKQPNGLCRDSKENFWENQGFKFIASMSMLVLVIIAKR
ncbi:hypothetical protein PR202_ga11174 [Eleusine coracana subsp. coracana]|uniref:Uncharacterized protein n=1 Tax=Eleusine coracana subsp. coracana TaxID=191504 RepID=A0AAV5C902_ELECO|nr:hypothetical protein PR202_ga11174 [Eleusine coracana subsp. coracana]